jgi:hypothetical protein
MIKLEVNKFIEIGFINHLYFIHLYLLWIQRVLFNRNYPSIIFIHFINQLESFNQLVIFSFILKHEPQFNYISKYEFCLIQQLLLDMVNYFNQSYKISYLVLLFKQVMVEVRVQILINVLIVNIILIIQ